MAPGKKQKFDFDLQGLRYFRQFKPLLKRLASMGTDRDKAANRRLVMDQYCTLILLWLFNPLLSSLRGLQHGKLGTVISWCEERNVSAIGCVVRMQRSQIALDLYSENADLLRICEHREKFDRLFAARTAGY